MGLLSGFRLGVLRVVSSGLLAVDCGSREAAFLRVARSACVSSSFCLAAVALATPTALVPMAFRGTAGDGFACTVLGAACFEAPSESELPSVRFAGTVGGFLLCGGWFGNSFM